MVEGVTVVQTTKLGCKYPRTSAQYVDAITPTIRLLEIPSEDFEANV